MEAQEMKKEIAKMGTTVRVTEGGRITIPKEVRMLVGIGGKDILILRVKDGNQILLTPAVVAPRGIK